ncbi:MAG: LysR family transcriptional regulator [Pigmentiphaga sp.]|uniref:LysR family transcriptional regulator n=1 Tax=Pigmentiphaga sp. TaxID=1977564 RepID=UPI00299FAC89|nr:LysR family transcriptional regulator [Pigmentiphaga sp.]MDX3905270.1 LysR family transcriptional regulator [Pigmentiphaga sp.]
MSKLLELRHLRAVLATAETGSLHQAAALLGTSQPALSRLLREAEERIGICLFERTPHGSRATAAGMLAEQVARRIEADVQRLHDMARDGRWHLRVGCIPRALDLVVPDLLHHLPEPLADRVQIDLREDDSLTLMASLNRGDLDLAILSLIGETPGGLLSRKLYLDRNVFVCGLPGPEIPDQPLSPQFLARHLFAAPAPGTPSRLEFDRYWHEHGVAVPPCRVAARTYDAIASVLPGTSLLAVMPAQVAYRHAGNGTLRVLDVAHPLPMRPIHVVWPRHGLQPLTDQIIELIRPASAVPAAAGRNARPRRRRR